jgi:hypothetical protein
VGKIPQEDLGVDGRLTYIWVFVMIIIIIIIIIITGAWGSVVVKALRY